MIYVIRVPHYDEEKKEFSFILKIGYTDDNNKKRRFDAYFAHCPGIKVLYEIPGGTEDHEKRLHYKFKDLHFCRNEYFIYDQSIIDYFESNPSLESIGALPKKAVREDKRVSNEKKSVRKIARYLFSSKSEMEDYLDKVFTDLGDFICPDKFIEYLKKDSSFPKERLDWYYEVKNSMETGNYCEDSNTNKLISRVISEYYQARCIVDKLKVLCSLEDSLLNKVLYFISDQDQSKSYLTIIGKDKIKAMSYNISNMNNLLKKVTFSPLVLENAIYQEFKEGDKIPLSEIKIKLGNIYSDIGYVKNPVGSDILEFFKIQESSVYEIIDGR